MQGVIEKSVRWEKSDPHCVSAMFANLQHSQRIIGHRLVDVLLADRAYDSDMLRTELAARGDWANITPVPNRKRRPAFSAVLYRYRNLDERFFSKLKQFRAVATRHDKRDDNFLAFVQLASIRIWMRHNESVAKGTV